MADGGLHFPEDGRIFEIREDNSRQFEAAVDRAVAAALVEIGQRAEAYAKAECPVDTGRLRNSITNQLQLASDSVLVGSDVDYCEYVEKDDNAAHVNGNAHFLRHAGEKHREEYARAMERHLQNA